MRTVAQYKARREQEKREGKFHLAHFPIGTVVEVECPTLKFLNEDERQYPGEAYPRKTTTIVGLSANGDNSFVFDMPEWCELSKDINTMNLQWIRKIVSRGTGKLNAEDQAIVDGIRKRRAEYMAKHHPKYPDNGYESETLQKTNEPANGNRYHISYFVGFLRQYMRERGYLNDLDQHLYNMDFITDFIYSRLTKRYRIEPYSEEAGFCFGPGDYTVSKKQFAKLFKQAIAKGKHCRRVVAAIEAARQNELYSREWEHDYDNGDY